MNTTVSLYGKCRYRIMLPVFFILAISSFIMSSCKSKTESFEIYEFRGVKQVCNYFKTNIEFETDSVSPIFIAGKEGDLFVCDDVILIKDHYQSGGAFSIFCDDSVMLVNGKIYAVFVPDCDQMIPWFNTMQNKDLSSLQFILYDKSAPDCYTPYLKEIAQIRPDVSIYSDGTDLADLNVLLDFFHPRYLIGISLGTDQFDQMEKLENLEVLWAELTDTIIGKPLPRLPHLRSLFISNQSGKEGVPANFLENNPQLENLYIEFTGEIDLTIISPLQHLKELVVQISDSIRNLDLLNQCHELEVLSIVESQGTYDPALINLPDLKWTTFDTEVSQKNFDEFIARHQKLEMVEFINNDTIADLNSLLSLKYLKGVSITDTVTDPGSILQLKQLSYLSLPDHYLSEAGNRSGLQEALPNTRISANHGYLCLGSGWLLLIIPFVILIRILMPRKSSESVG